jgi:hypothetical protein
MVLICIGRALGSFVVLVVEYRYERYWLFIFMSCLPSLLFFTTFSLFIYFLARIVVEEESDALNLLKPFFIFFNVFVYISFFGISIYSTASY